MRWRASTHNQARYFARLVNVLRWTMTRLDQMTGSDMVHALGGDAYYACPGEKLPAVPVSWLPAVNVAQMPRRSPLREQP